MEPTRNYFNYRVVVEVALQRRMTSENHESNHKQCKRLEWEVQRHCDYWLATHVEWDVELVCPNCGLTWELDESGEPMCCDAAARVWKAEQEPAG